MKVQLPHERYADMSARLPGLIERALQQAAWDDGTAAAALDRQATAGSTGNNAAQPGAASGAPRLLTYTHFEGCLAAVLQYASEQPLPPAARIKAGLQQLLPEGMQLSHVFVQETSSAITPAAGECAWPGSLAIASNVAGTSSSLCGVAPRHAAPAGRVRAPRMARALPPWWFAPMAAVVSSALLRLSVQHMVLRRCCAVLAAL